jgi:hypothetical protein
MSADAGEAPVCQFTGADAEGDLLCSVTKPSTMLSNFCQNATNTNSCDRGWQFNALYTQVSATAMLALCQPHFTGCPDSG